MDGVFDVTCLEPSPFSLAACRSSAGRLSGLHDTLGRSCPDSAGRPCDPPACSGQLGQRGRPGPEAAGPRRGAGPHQHPVGPHQRRGGSHQSVGRKSVRTDADRPAGDRSPGFCLPGCRASGRDLVSDQDLRKRLPACRKLSGAAGPDRRSTGGVWFFLPFASLPSARLRCKRPD